MPPDEMFRAQAMTPPDDAEALQSIPGEGWKHHEDIGLIALVGPVWERNDGDGPKLAFVADERHINRAGVVHGGMLMTFMDHALGVALLDGAASQNQVTIQLDSHFMSSVRPGEFVEADCTIERRTRSLVFMRGKLLVGARVVYTASGIWKLLDRG